MKSNNSRKAKSLRAARGGSQSRKTNGRGIGSLPGGEGITLYKSPRTVMPSTYVTNLKYIVQDTVTNVGGVRASISFRTEAYDVDPALGSTAMPGFAELGALYARYRALRMTYKFSVANQEAFSITTIHGFSNSSIASGSLSIGYAGNPLFNSGMLGPLTGQGRATYRQSASVVAVAGSQQPLFDDLYTGSTASATLATAGTTWCYFGVITPVVMTAAGVLVTVEITLQVQFYRPLFILV